MNPSVLELSCRSLRSLIRRINLKQINLKRINVKRINLKRINLNLRPIHTWWR